MPKKHYIQVDLILSETESYEAGANVDLSEHPELESFIERGLVSERGPRRRNARKTANQE